MSRWIRSRALYTPPVTSWECVAPEVVCLTFGGRPPRCDTRLGRSRNKVALGEPGAGSPPKIYTRLNIVSVRSNYLNLLKIAKLTLFRSKEFFKSIVIPKYEWIYSFMINNFLLSIVDCFIKNFLIIHQVIFWDLSQNANGKFWRLVIRKLS